MSGEATGDAAPQAGAATQPQVGTTTGGQEPPAGTGQAPASGTQPGTDTETDGQKAARLDKELRETRSEAASWRTKAQTYERTEAQRKQEGMSEAEKATARATALEQANTELTARLRQQAVQGAALSAASKLGFRNPELAYRLLDTGELEFDDAGIPKNAEKLLRELATREPYLVKPTGQDFGGGQRGTQPDSTPGMNELLKAAIAGGN